MNSTLVQAKKKQNQGLYNLGLAIIGCYVALMLMAQPVLFGPMLIFLAIPYLKTHPFFRKHWKLCTMGLALLLIPLFIGLYAEPSQAFIWRRIEDRFTDMGNFARGCGATGATCPTGVTSANQTFDFVFLAIRVIIFSIIGVAGFRGWDTFNKQGEMDMFMSTAVGLAAFVGLGEVASYFIFGNPTGGGALPSFIFPQTPMPFLSMLSFPVSSL